jgi:hypothetical protein
MSERVPRHIAKMMESQQFKEVVRAQLTKSGSKQCTYFALDNDDNIVFVKGPFQSHEEAKCAVDVCVLKELVANHLPSQSIKLVQLVPDGGPDLCQLGFRTTIESGDDMAYWFQVTTGVLPGETWPLPTKTRSSPSAWPDPVQIVDWSSMTNTRHVEYNKVYSKTIYATDPDAAIQFVSNIFISYVIGAGPDLTFSNFIHDDASHTVLHVGVDRWDSGDDWWITNTRVGSKRSKAYEHLKKFIDQNGGVFTKLFDGILKALYAHDGDPLLTFMSRPCYERAIKKTRALINNWETANVVCNPKRERDIRSEHPRGSEKCVKYEKYSDTQSTPGTPRVQVTQGKEIEIEITTTPETPCVQEIEILSTSETPCVQLNQGKEIEIPGSPGPLVCQDAVILPSYDDVANSFQQAIRTNKFAQALTTFFACYNACTRSKIIILNKMTICALEDIGVANYRLVLCVVTFIDKQCNNLELYDANSTMVKGIIAKYIYNMCASVKTNIQIHISHTFNEKNRYVALEAGVRWNNIPSTFHDPGYIRIMESNHKRAWGLFKPYVPCVFYDTWGRLPKPVERGAVVRFVFTAIHMRFTRAINIDISDTRSCSISPTPHTYCISNYFNVDITDITDVGDYNTRLYNEDTVITNPVYKRIYQQSKIKNN